MKRAFAPATVAGLIAMLVLLVGSQGAGAAKEAGAVGSASKVVLFSSDGMRPDLMEKYAQAGAMPTYKKLMSTGVAGQNGLVQAFPPNTGVGWYTMATGTYPSEHGSTNNTFHRGGESNFNNSTSFSGTGVLQADTIANAAERAGKKVAQVDWVGGRSANIQGPTVDFANFFSTRGVLAAPVNTTEQAGAASFGISYQVAAVAPAGGWSNAPASNRPLRETILTVATTFAAQNPTRTYDVLIYATGSGYDHVLLVRTADGKDASKAAVRLAVGDFKGIKLQGADGLIGARAGQTASFYAKLITLAPDLSSFKLYFTSVTRPIATCGAPCAALPAGGSGEDKLEKYIADNLPGWIAADFAPLEARIIDEDTYVEQARDLEREYADAVMKYILGTLQPDTDLALVGYPVTDEMSHQFMGLYTPTDMNGNANPYFDDVEGDGVKDNRVAIREGYVRSAYHEADAKLGLARQLMGGNPTTFAAADHGFAAQWYAANARKVLFDADLQASGGNTASNCRADAADLTKACWAGGTAQIYVNPKLPAGTTYEQVRTAVVNAFENLNDPANSGAQVVARVMKKEQLRNVDGSDSLHPNRSGDVVVVLRPPYQWDAATPGQRIAFSQFFGQHGYLPNLVDIPHNVNMHATFVAGGPGIKKDENGIAGVRAIDLAPTISFLMGIPGPQNARGKILYDVAEKTADLREVTVLDISDYHGQLIPLSEAADNLAAPAVNPNFDIGGAAFLKPWFDWYRSEAKDGSITIAAGDSVGATPPISSFFGDKPTIELMNLMGFGADGLGNHNFDRGQNYLRTELIPLAKFPYLSANVVDAAGNTPAEWSPSRVFDFGRGVKLAFVGFTNEDAPTLVSGNAFAPFRVANATSSVNATIARVKNQVDGVVAMGHLGATAGTLTAPTGPLVDLADNVSGADAVIGDHTDVQVLTSRSNGVLLTENRSKGIRFTRIRLVIDKEAGVVYKTADFHKPWDIGITPDAAIDSRLSELNGILAPILNALVGNSTRFIPRADACGNSAGRTCESLVGNVTADSMRTTYGTDFAITNSGGLRADLTCPTSDNPRDFCPAYTPPPYPITRGQVVTVLPFGNLVVTTPVNGAELKTMLENGVSRMPGVDGRFPQVSGLCFTYDISAPVGSRVTGAVRQAADGSCTGAPVDLTAASTYTLAENDFMASGGDGYPVFADRATLKDLMEGVVADYIRAKGTISPAIQGRVNCTGAGCPTVTP